MISKNMFKDKTIKYYLEKYSFINNFFEENNLELNNKEITFEKYFESLDSKKLEERGMEKEKLEKKLLDYVNQMIEFLGLEEEEKIRSLRIIAGNDKDGKEESFGELKINTSEIISIVGPTGSGKSRLLADIEWTAQRDTPTNRKIMVNEKKPDKKWRYSSSNKLVAQLSQNMNFVMDLSVYEFLELHAKSRLV
ncbi:MAG: ATP-binding cassette domain-containing protein, partial [Fusobacteriota bacterium]